jgi:transposase
MMAKTYEITEEQILEIKKQRKENNDKNVEKRLRAVQLRGEGLGNKEIGLIVESHPDVVSRWVCNYLKHGLTALMNGKRGGNRRNMTLDEESKFIASFKEKAEKGQLVTVKEIKVAYCEKIGHKCGNGQIYRVLKRQQWRKVVPRKEHPNKASEAEIEASKKLTFGTTN